MAKILSFVLVGQDKLTPVVQKAGKEAEKSAGKMGGAYKEAGKMIRAATLTVAIGIGAAAKAAGDYQEQLTKLVTGAGESSKNLDLVSTSIKQIAVDTGTTLSQLTSGAFMIESAGYHGAAGMTVLRAAAQGAKTSGADLGTVANALTTIMTDYHFKTDDAAKAQSGLNAIVSNGKTNLQDLSASMARALPTASSLSVSFDSVGGAMATLTGEGISAKLAAMGINAAMLAMAAPSSAAIKQMDALGLSSKTVANDLTHHGILKAITDITDAAGRQFPVGSAGYVAAVNKMMGGNKGLQVALGLTGTHLETARKNTKAVADAMRAAGKDVSGWAETQKDFNLKLAQFKETGQVTAVTLGTTLLPMLTGLMTNLAKVLIPLSKNKAAFATLAAGITLFAITAKLAMTAFASSAKAALVTSVVGIAILGLSVAITLLLTHWQTVLGWMKDAVNAFRDVGINALKALVNYFLWMPGIIIHAAAVAFGWVPGLGPKLKEAAKKFDEFRDDVNKSLDGLKGKNINVGVAMTAASNPYPGGISGRKATGGHIRGPGGPRSDTAGLFALSNGEYVQPTSAVNYYGVGMMEAIRSRRFPRMAGGGGVNVTANTPSADSINSNIWNSLVKYVQKNFMSSFAGSAMSGFGTGGNGGSGVQKWAGLVMQVLGMLGQSPAWLSTVLRRMNQESGGNQFAVNNWDSNAMAGHPSMGLMQTIPGTFNAYAGPFRGLGIFNPLANIYAGINYAIHAYGSLAGMNRAGGYAAGGAVAFDSGFGMLRPGYSLAYNGTGKNEFLSAGGSGVVVNVNIHGHALASKQEIGREVADALKVFRQKGGNV